MSSKETDSITANLSFTSDKEVRVITTQTKIKEEPQTYDSYNDLVKSVGRQRFLNDFFGVSGRCVAIGGIGAEILSFGKFIVEEGVHLALGEGLLDQTIKIAFLAGCYKLIYKTVGDEKKLTVIEREIENITDQIPNITVPSSQA